jgi:hypothetical protein
MEEKKIIKKIDAERKELEANFENKNSNVLTTKPVNQWMKEASARPDPKQLVGSLLYEGELSVFFGDSNTGKSIGAVQIGDNVSKGKGTLGLINEANLQKVLIIDCELSDKVFQKRYTHEKKLYQFHENFNRAEINTAKINADSESLGKMIIESIKIEAIENKIKIFIIDNITFLGSEMEKSKNALPLMKNLQELTKKLNITILILAHTPKRDATRPITNNDLAGSKMIMNFVDSAFTIGRSCKAPNIRYIKQIKVRNSEEQYGGNNVIVCEIVKPKGFLHFKFIETDAESNHLISYGSKKESDEEFQSQIKEALNKNPDISLRGIKDEIGANDHKTVKRHVKSMYEAKQIEFPKCLNSKSTKTL